MADRCEVQIDAQTNREVAKIRPEADNATLQSMYDGITLGERAQAEREMREALRREQNKTPEPVKLTEKDFAKHGIKVDGEKLIFPNGLVFDNKKHGVDTGDPGKAGGIFMIKNVLDGDKNLVRKEFYSNATDRVGYSDTAGMLLHVPANNGEFVVNQVTGDVTYKANKVLCGGLPQLTLEDAKKANKEERKKQEAKDLDRPWDQ